MTMGSTHHNKASFGQLMEKFLSTACAFVFNPSFILSVFMMTALFTLLLER
jgi:hypothetical protein